MPTTPKHTTLGTPCARSWSNDWFATVDATEHERNHRICGARLPDATPCCNESGHPSGRCPFHGGFDLTGAPQGNRNHVIHGLYSRRLRPCTQTCPHWQTCPIANRHPRPGEFGKHGDPATHPDRHPRENGDPSSHSAPNPCENGDPSSLQTKDYGLQPSSNPQSAVRSPQSEPPQSAVRNPQSEPLQPPASSLQPSPASSLASLSSFRSHPTNAKPPQSPPTCVYQLAEYNTVLTDALAIVESQPHPNPMGIHTAHNVATLQVLVSTAAAQLAQAPNLWTVEDPNPDHPNPTPQTPNPSMVLAFTRLMREFRHSLKLLNAPGSTPLNRQNSTGAPPTAEGILRHAERSKHDTGLDPDSIADAQLQPQTPETHAKAFIQQAALAGGQGRDVEMCEAFDNAALLDEPYAESERSHVLASYRPARHSVSEELAEAILGHLHLEPPPPSANGNHQHTDNTTPQNSSTTRSNTNEFAAPIPPSKGDQGGCSAVDSAVSAPPSKGVPRHRRGGGCSSPDSTSIARRPDKASPEMTNDSGVPIPPSKGDQGGCSSRNATTTGPINQAEIASDANDLLQYYLDLIRDGKMPPEAFPIGSPYRVHAETRNASPPAAATPQSLGQETPSTPKFPDGGAAAPA